jgi:hypothetical protein
MSIWTSKAAILLASLSLAACVAGGGARVVQFGPAGASGFAVAAPAGFCAAPDATNRIGRADFVAFARCAGTTGEPALLTATVGAPGSAGPDDPDPQALAAFFTSDAGRRVLSLAGRADSVTVHEVQAVDGAVLVRLTDRSTRSGRAGGESWRAVVAVGGRLVTLSAGGGAGVALPRENGRQIIGAFVRSVRGANGAAV